MKTHEDTTYGLNLLRFGSSAIGLWWFWHAVALERSTVLIVAVVWPIPQLMMTWGTLHVLYAQIAQNARQHFRLLSCMACVAAILTMLHHCRYRPYVAIGGRFLSTEESGCVIHPRYGYLPKDGTSRLAYGEFDTTRKFEDGFRVYPSNPPDPKETYLFLGCSITEGYGVNLPYPEVLKQRRAPHLAVVNRAVPGWGIIPARLLLEDILPALKPRPTRVFYGWIADHFRRSFLDLGYVKEHSRVGAAVPYYSFRSGKFEGIVRWNGKTLEFSESKDDPRALEMMLLKEGMRSIEEKEAFLTRDALRTMKSLCDSMDIPFTVILLPNSFVYRHYWQEEGFLKICREENIEVYDLRTYNVPEYFLRDGHPNAVWHQIIGEALNK